VEGRNVSLELAAITHRFGTVEALRGLDVTFPRQRATVLLGPNGAGKSTLLRVAAHLLRPQRGRVALDGRGLSAWGRAERAATIGYIAQRPLFSAGLTVRTVLELGLLVSQDAGVGVDAVRHTLSAMGLDGEASRPVTGLSIGQQQRVAIARTLVQTGALRWALPNGEAHRAGRAPPMLLLDEPFAALDPAHVGLVLTLLHRCVAGGCGVVAAIHDLHVAAALADEVVILRDGCCMAHGPAASTLAPETLERLYGLAFERCGESVVPVLARRQSPT